MILITTLGEEPAVAAILVWLWLISANKVQVLKLISMVALSAYIMSIAKIIYEVTPIETIVATTTLPNR
jgi:hypothetical protein